MATTIQVREGVKEELKQLKMYERETYNDILERILEDFKELNEETKREVELARKEIARGKFKTHEDLKAGLGF